MRIAEPSQQSLYRTPKTILDIKEYFVSQPEHSMDLFSTVDYFIICLYLCVVIGVGLWASRSVKTLDDYATGNRSYSSVFIFATLSASFIGGGFTSGLAEKVYRMGLFYVIGLWGFSVKEVLIAKYVAPRMTAFRDAISVGDIMGRLYGENARVLTGIASVLVCAGIAGAQFGAFGYMINMLLGIPQVWGILICASVVILYSSLGGMKAVVANDTLHFIVLIIALPLVFLLGLNQVGGMKAILSIPNFDAMGSDIPWFAIAGLFLSFFFGETLVPPYVQRLLIGKDIQSTVQGTLWSGLLSFPFFLMIGLIGLIAHKLNPGINPNMALPYVIQTVMPIGLKGLAVAGMIAVIMSSADSFLNAAGIAAAHDVIKPLKGIAGKHKELIISRFTTLTVGVMGAGFAASTESVLDILLHAYNFWTPFILVPLIAGIMGYKRPPQTFWISSFLSISAVIIVNNMSSFGASTFDGTLTGILVNMLVFFTYNPAKRLAGV